MRLGKRENEANGNPGCIYIYMHGGEKGAKSNKARKTKLVLKGVAICFVRASQLLL